MSEDTGSFLLQLSSSHNLDSVDATNVRSLLSDDLDLLPKMSSLESHTFHILANVVLLQTHRLSN